LNPNAVMPLPSSILEDSNIDSLPFSGKKTRLEGIAPLWMYAHFAVRAVMNGTEELSIRQADAGYTLIWQRGPLLKAGGAADTPCFTITQKSSDTIRLEFITPPDEKGGKWTMADLTETPLNFIVSSAEVASRDSPPANTEVLIIGGPAANWMYAAVTVAAHSAGIKHILYESPREKAYISIGALKPGKLIQYQKRGGNGLVIGIVGDPNSGKSVFRDWLEKIIKDEWPNSWWIDADPAAPTPNWFLYGLYSGKTDEEIRNEVINIRKKNKKDWAPELESMVADNIRNARENLDVIIVDLPGGNFSDKSRPKRIPKGREVIFKEIDLFIILWIDDAARKGWLSALREHNMEHLVFAEIKSCDHESPPSLETHREGHLIKGTARGLDRGNIYHYAKQSVKSGSAEFIRYIYAWTAVRHAKAAAAKAFLTGQGGVRYGAAVLCMDGKIYTAGQYSSFNHSTNIHAEQGALLQAAMNGSFAVRALALVSTDNSAMPRPCGICRQVMIEHIAHTGSAFDVAMADNEGRVEIERADALLPLSWASHKSRGEQDRPLRDREPRLLSAPPDERFRTGNCVQWTDNETTAIGIVWESDFLPGRMLARLKYLKNPSGEWRELPNSLTESFNYMNELQKTGFAGPAGFGPSACLVKPSEIEGIAYAKIEGDAEPPKEFTRFLEDAGISVSRLGFTGSRALGLERENSGFVFFGEAKAEEILRFRKTAQLYLKNGKASIPGESGTWRFFDKAFPGGIKRITEEERFFESLEFGGKKISVIFTSDEKFIAYNEDEWDAAGWHTVSGVVQDDSRAPFKRACFALITDFHRQIEVVSYCKFANLVKTGDRLSLGGWLLKNKKNESVQRLIQILPGNDPIVWLS